MRTGPSAVIYCFCFFTITFIPFSCKDTNNDQATVLINSMDLKRGEVISCGTENQQYGTVDFQTSCGEKVTENINLGIKLLHSFEYDEAEKVFAKIIDQQPDCAMAYWGVAMSNFHPLWTPPTEAELQKGMKAIAIAQSFEEISKREQAYINAIAAFYTDSDKKDHHTRCLQFEKEMETLHSKYPNDKEAAVFYALALNAAADPADKSFAKQKMAGKILNDLYPEEQNHPGIVHYIIHTYDYPELAHLALPAARKYASVAPSSAHALHMPSHIFTRMGLWDECIGSNIASVTSAQCYAEAAGMKGHWDEEIHGLDYLVYGYLQKGENKLAKKQWDHLESIISTTTPVNFKVAYAYAAIPSRYLLENKQWNEAANLKYDEEKFSFNNFPWQKAIIHFTRVLGSVHTGKIDAARLELNELHKLHDTLMKQKDAYKANQVDIQIKSAEAWISYKEGNNEEALRLMHLAADMEDKTEKHPVTPGEVVPARQLLGDLLLQMNKNEEALQAYEADLKKHPNRFNGLYGAAIAAERVGNREKAKSYCKQLFSIVYPDSDRPEIPKLKQMVKG